MLDKSETQRFLKMAKQYTNAERAQNYDETNFNKIFEEYDEDKNGFIEKGEMAVLLKKVFAAPKAETKKAGAKFKAANNESLMMLLGSYSQHFGVNLDQLWAQHDYDRNGMLDKEECKNFIDDLLKYIAPERGENYQAHLFEVQFAEYDSDKNGFLEKSEMAVFIKKAFANDQKEVELPPPPRRVEGGEINLVSLVKPQDTLDHTQVIQYLKELLDVQRSIRDPAAAIESIFNKILAWKRIAGNLDDQEKMVAEKLKQSSADPIQIHNVKTLKQKLSEFTTDIGLTN